MFVANLIILDWMLVTCNCLFQSDGPTLSHNANGLEWIDRFFYGFASWMEFMLAVSKYALLKEVFHQNHVVYKQ